jgi:hypothetical protein
MLSGAPVPPEALEPPTKGKAKSKAGGKQRSGR